MEAGRSPSIKAYVMILEESSCIHVVYGNESLLPSLIRRTYPYTQDSQIQITSIQEIPYTGLRGRRKFQLILTTPFNLTYTHHIYISTIEEHEKYQIHFLPKSLYGHLFTPLSHRIIKK